MRTEQQQLQRERMEHFLRNSTPTQLAAFSVAFITSLSLHGMVDNTSLVSWIGLFTLITFTRLVLSIRLQRKLKDNGEIVESAFLYIWGPLLSGISWAYLFFFTDIQHPLMLQIYLVILLVGMPIAALPSTAINLPTFYLFSVPIFIGMAAWIITWGEGWRLYFVVTEVGYLVLISVTAITYHKNLMSSLRNRIEVEVLMKALKESHEKLEILAYIDPLTELPNRRQFNRYAENALQRTRRNNSLLGVILIDLDRFKQVNDTYGHKAGDQLLVHIGERIKASIRASDAICRNADAARIGGDEFIVLVEDAQSRENVAEIAERLSGNLKAPLNLSDTTYTPSCSIGIALSPDHASDIDNLLHFADQAMYQAKRDPTVEYIIYQPEMSS